MPPTPLQQIHLLVTQINGCNQTTINQCSQPVMNANKNVGTFTSRCSSDHGGANILNTTQVFDDEFYIVFCLKIVCKSSKIGVRVSSAQITKVATRFTTASVGGGASVGTSVGFTGTAVGATGTAVGSTTGVLPLLPLRMLTGSLWR